MANKTVLMCRPDYFEVAYEINDWMHVDDPVDVDLAKRQWQTLHDAYQKLGYKIELIEPVRGLPDMVFTANGGLVIDGKAMLPRFKFPQRQAETARFEAWFQAQGLTVRMPEREFEGEGDCLYGSFGNPTIFAGHGFRSDFGVRSELEDFFQRQVVSLKLVDPRFYHLDTAFCPIDQNTVMYYPGAFDQASLDAIEMHYRRRIIASEKDATSFGLNAVSDSENIVMSVAATDLIDTLRAKGYNPIGLDMTEFRKSGGAVRCCTLELRALVPAPLKSRP